jgi:hypothetical protein
VAVVPLFFPCRKTPEDPPADSFSANKPSTINAFAMGQYTIIISSGTDNITKVHVGIVNGFALIKGNPENKVDFVLMAEGGWVVDDKVMRSCNAFGLPPMANLLDAPEMNDPARVSWTV